MEEKKKRIISLLRSVLISSKEGIKKQSLIKDYELLTNEKLSFKDIGYSSLDEFISSIPDVVKVERKGPDIVYFAVADASIEKLKELVSKQKSTKRPCKINKPRARQATIHYYKTDFKSKEAYQSNYNSSVKLKPKPLANITQVMPHRVPPIQKRFPPSRINNNLAVPSENNIDIPLYRTQFSKSFEIPPRFKKKTIGSNLTHANIVQHMNEDNVVKNGSYKQILENYVKTNVKEPVVYRSFQTGKSHHWVCSVNIDQKIFGSCQSFPSKAQAENEAAKNAVERLKLDRENGTKTSAMDIRLILERVRQIVDGCKNGVWNTKVAIEYKEKYKENLPDMFCKLELHPKCIKLERIGGRYIIYPGEMTYSDYINSLTNSIDDFDSEVFLNLESYSNTMFEDSLPEPDSLQVPSGNLWDVYITFVNSAVDVALRIIGEEYSEKYEALQIEMENFYKNGNGIQASKIKVGHIYIIEYNKEWSRVRVIDGTEKVKIFFVDEGDVDEVEKENLFYIEPQFNKLPYQVLKCELHKLQDYADNLQVLDLLVEYITGKVFVAEVIKNDEVLELNLFDTSAESDILINDLILEKVGGLEFFPPELPQMNEFSKVTVSYVDPNGLLYIQIDGPGFRALEEMLIEINKKYQENPIIKPADPHISKLCFAKFSLDNLWYRAHITQVLEDDSKIEVHFVDYGNKDIICIKDIWRPDISLLHRLPLQAIPVTLHGYPVMSDFWKEENLKYVQKETMDYDGTMILQVIEPAHKSGMPAIVELIQDCDDGQIIHVRHKLANLDPERHIHSEEEDSSLGSSLTSSESNSISQASGIISEFSLIPERSSTSEYPLTNGSSNSSELKSFSEVTTSVKGEGDKNENVHPNYPLTNTTANQLTSKSSMQCCQGIPPPLEIPNIGEYFDVFVSLAMDPGNFTCQPWKTGGYLELLMHSLQEYYSNMDNFVPLENVVEGQLYAAKHMEDNRWYRVLAKEVISEKNEAEMISIYFVDYGDFCLCSSSQLQPLWQQFCKLPYQAIRAQLSGIMPLGSHWSPVECQAFSELVLEKPLVAFIINQVTPPTNQHMLVLTVKLIDTSNPDKDIYIENVLISRGLAKTA